MKTTLDLPADLVREMKIRAAQDGRKLRDVATEIFRRGLKQPASPTASRTQRVELPLIECSKAKTPADEMTADRVSDLLLKQEVEWKHDAAGH